MVACVVEGRVFCTHVVSETVTDFCMVIKLYERKYFTGSTTRVHAHDLAKIFGDKY